VIRKDGESNQIMVQHWSASKNLGITLDDNVTTPPAPAPETTRTIVGDLKPIEFEDVLAADTVINPDWRCAEAFESSLQQVANDNKWRMAA
jgi:hypothetical protein